MCVGRLRLAGESDTLFNAMTGYFLYADFNSIENLSSIALDINQLLFGLLGVAMIIRCV